MSRVTRGDGIGIELAMGVLRGVRLAHDGDVPAAVAEVPLHDLDDDRSVLDALVRLRAELGGVALPTRLATFPAGSAMHRTDVTGLTGPELNALRAEVELRLDATSSLLVDHGPRRFMYVLHWDPSGLRRLEDLGERAGFLDVAVDPSPVALARVVRAGTTSAVRCASTDVAFSVAIDDGIVVAAASIVATGRRHPALELGASPYSVALFDELVQPAEIAEQLATLVQDRGGDAGPLLQVDGTASPDFPPMDLRSPERQCVALGAAVGAAGLIGRLRPVDVVTAPQSTGVPDFSRPWAIERVGSLPRTVDPTAPSGFDRLTAKLRLRRRR